MSGRCVSGRENPTQMPGRVPTSLAKQAQPELPAEARSRGSPNLKISRLATVTWGLAVGGSGFHQQLRLGPT